MTPSELNPILLGRFIFFLLTIVFFIPIQTIAQVDPSTVLLLKKGTNSRDDLNSSRYLVKPKTEESKSVRPQAQSIETRQPQDFKASGVPNNNTRISDANVTSKTVVENKKSDSSAILPGSTGLSIEKNESSVDDQIQFDDESLKAAEGLALKSYDITAPPYELRSFFHPQDKRRNLLEFSLGTGYFYQNSASIYWPRNYFVSGQSLSTDLKLWMTPFLGVRASYQTSLNGDLRATPEGSERVDADHSWFQAGIAYRKYFGIHKKAKSILFAVDYFEYQFDVATTAEERMGLTSRGMSLEFEVDIPVKQSQSWQLGITIQPDLSHNEIISDRNIKSGKSNSSNSLGLHYGRKITFNRKNEFYWRLSHRMETNRFSGNTRVEDPLRDEVLRGISVQNSTSQFSLGFTWGR